jgi:hypothetical protein
VVDRIVVGLKETNKIGKELVNIHSKCSVFTFAVAWGTSQSSSAIA